MKKVAILGLGFIGKNLLNSYLKNNCIIYILDKKPCPAEFDNIKSIIWINGCLNEIEKVNAILKNVDIVYHLISSTVPGDEVDENEEINKNVIETINLLKACVKNEIKKIIFLSSASVYGIQTSLPIIEDASTNPISPHGIHKLTIEKYLLYFKHKFNLNSNIIRLSNPYGYGQDIFGRQGLIAICLGKIINNETLEVLGDGTAIRDFIHISDVISACHLVEESESNNTIFNIGSGVGFSINEILDYFKIIFKHRFNFEYKDYRLNDISNSILDTTRAFEILGFQTKISLMEGINMTIHKHIEEYPDLKVNAD